MKASHSLSMGIAAAAWATTLLASSAVAEPKYKADVPQSLITLDKVQTEMLGELDFTDGMPSEETVRKTIDFLDTSRAAEAFLTGMPATSIYAMLEGMKQAGAKPGDLVLWENYGDARTIALTFNTSTPYAFAEINVKDEPAIVDVPAGTLVGAGYRAALACNVWLNWIRRRFGFGYWSFSYWAKLRVKNAVNLIGRFEEVLSSEASRSNVQGVICGHIHHAAMHDDFGVRYINTGDWVESRARAWSSAIAGSLKSSDGRRRARRWMRRSLRRSRGRPPDARAGGNRRLAATGQWCGPLARISCQ